jgi:hypothetical protein
VSEQRFGHHVVRFERDSFRAGTPFTFIGDGELGGKASGLAAVAETVATMLPRESFAGIEVAIPSLAVVTTTHFDVFMTTNELWEVASAGLADERIAHAFLRAELPIDLIGDLRALAAEVRTPLAVRSSSLLEDALERPLAGVYATKMIPNNQLDADSRFRKLAEAVKLVYASTFFHEARSYRATLGIADDTEKMAVVIQEVVGQRFGDRFYPNLSAVGRSYNYYPYGHARPEDGMAQLALGLGKTIVDGEGGWSYSPAYPKTPRPFKDFGDMLKSTQTTFWAVNMGSAQYDPTAETEHMVRCELSDAEIDDTIRFVACTFDPQANRLVPGVWAKGPRVLNFAPLLQYNQAPVNDMIRALLAACQDSAGGPVEIELAVTLDVENALPARCGFLQVRPLVVADEQVTIADAEMTGERALLASKLVLGNGVRDQLVDVVYVRPGSFSAAATAAIARDIDRANEALVKSGHNYVLIGFGRWGTTDPSGGIPVNWGQLSGARVIVEAVLPQMRTELSQGSHFFHNLTSFGVLYLSVDESASRAIDWSWLDRQPAELETEYVRHVRLSQPLVVKVDGRTGRGVIVRHG